MQCPQQEQLFLEQQREKSDALTLIFIVIFLLTTYIWTLFERY